MHQRKFFFLKSHYNTIVCLSVQDFGTVGKIRALSKVRHVLKGLSKMQVLDSVYRMISKTFLAGNAMIIALAVSHFCNNESICIIL